MRGMVDIAGLHHHKEFLGRNLLKMVKAESRQFRQCGCAADAVDSVAYLCRPFLIRRSEQNFPARFCRLQLLNASCHRIAVLAVAVEYPRGFFLVVACQRVGSGYEVESALRAVAVDFLVHLAVCLMREMRGRGCIIVANGRNDSHAISKLPFQLVRNAFHSHRVGTDSHHAVLCLHPGGKSRACRSRIGYRRACRIGHGHRSHWEAHHQDVLIVTEHGAVVSLRSHHVTHTHAVADEHKHILRLCRPYGDDGYHRQKS